MKLLPIILLLATSVSLVAGACNPGLGRREFGDFQMYILHATKGPFFEAQNISLTFDYQVNPIDTIEVTFVDINTSLENQCVTTFPGTQVLARGFEITVTTLNPVLEFSGTATVFGIRRL
ncbi:uncharacterized protein LOC110680721 [Aedes aegypti]|uniref:Uncharacterized protein n=1 Tax=Aedes aegypti TaxID=7159 RepID=A0A903VTX0_AEDAE|nr:uncharacterized protein LOC110680721 [Aedes aegypti]